jgi:hypothetical protein
MHAVPDALCRVPDALPDSPAAAARCLVVVNARVHTGDPRRPWADAVLVRDGTLVAVGASAELRKRAGVSALVIDARGLLALPRTPGDVLHAGAPADLVLVERIDHAVEDELVFVLEGGRIVHDRLHLASGQVP